MQKITTVVPTKVGRISFVMYYSQSKSSLLRPQIFPPDLFFILFFRFLENRGIVVNYKLHNFQSLGHSYNVVFNCCGLGAIELCLDNEVVPIRGQILQVALI